MRVVLIVNNFHSSSYTICSRCHHKHCSGYVSKALLPAARVLFIFLSSSFLIAPGGDEGGEKKLLNEFGSRKQVWLSCSRRRKRGDGGHAEDNKKHPCSRSLSGALAGPPSVPPRGLLSRSRCQSTSTPDAHLLINLCGIPTLAPRPLLTSLLVQPVQYNMFCSQVPE